MLALGTRLMDDHVAAAAKPVHPWLDNARHKTGDDGRVDRIAAAGKDGRSGFGGQTGFGGDHAPPRDRASVRPTTHSLLLATGLSRSATQLSGF